MHAQHRKAASANRATVLYSPASALPETVAEAEGAKVPCGHLRIGRLSASVASMTPPISGKCQAPAEFLDQERSCERQQPLSKCASRGDHASDKPPLLRKPLAARRNERRVEYREAKAAIDQASDVISRQRLLHSHREQRGDHAGRADCQHQPDIDSIRDPTPEQATDRHTSRGDCIA